MYGDVCTNRCSDILKHMHTCSIHQVCPHRWWWWRVKYPSLFWWRHWFLHIWLYNLILLYFLLPPLPQVWFLFLHHNNNLHRSTTSEDDDCVSFPYKRRPSPKVHRSICSYNWSQQSLFHCPSCGWAFWRTKWFGLSKRANRNSLHMK